MPPDWRPPKTVRDRGARKEFHRHPGTCAICGTSRDLSLHHVYDRDDVEGNFVFLCGDGVAGCHGLITRHDEWARARLGAFILRERHDIIEHVSRKIGAQAVGWFERRLLVDVTPILIGVGLNPDRGIA